MTGTTFDRDGYKRTTREQWQTAAAAWRRWEPLIESWLGEATELMLDLAGVVPGARVLDVAAGAGGQKLRGRPSRRPERRGARDRHRREPRPVPRAGRGRCRPDPGPWGGPGRRGAGGAGRELRRGHLPSRTHLPARPSARADGHAHRAAPGRPPLRDGLLDRGGQPVLLGAGVPRPGGREAAAADARPARPVRPRHARGPRRGADGGGIVDVDVRRVSAPLRLSSAAECVRFERESFGALHQMLAGLDTEAQDRVWQAIAEALGMFDGPDGFVGPCELLVVAAGRP